MNSTNTTQTAANKFIDLVVGTWFQEIMHLATLTPISLVAFVLNLLSFCILRKKPFQSSTFYKYFQVYTFSNLIILVLLSTTFVYKMYRTLFSLTNSYWAIFYGCYIHFPFILIFYLYISLLEICIIIERVYYFIPNRFKIIKISNYKKYCTLLSIFSVLINLPVYFKFKPSYIDFKSVNNTYLRIYYINLTEFSYSSISKELEHLTVIIRDLFTLLIKLILNAVFLVLIKRYTSKIKEEKKQFSIKISSRFLHFKSIILPQPETTTKYLSSTERNQTYIVIIMSIFSLVKHVLCLSSYVLILFYTNRLDAIFYYIFFLSIAIESILNILLLYVFNDLFRVNFKKILKNCVFYKFV